MVSDDTCYYDSAARQTIYRFHGPQNTQQKIYIFSLVDQNFEMDLIPNADTTININSTTCQHLTKGKLDSLPNLTIHENDTLFITQKVAGCFVDYREKLMIIKQNDYYKLEYRNTDPDFIVSSRMLPESFKGQFQRFLNNLKDFLIKYELINYHPKNNLRHVFFGLSTNTATLFFRKGKTVYEVPIDDKLSAFKDFKTQMGITEN